jgi:hypothetical protein
LLLALLCVVLLPSLLPARLFLPLPGLVAFFSCAAFECNCAFIL